jgi:hypothetical protein
VTHVRGRKLRATLCSADNVAPDMVIRVSGCLTDVSSES